MKKLSMFAAAVCAALAALFSSFWLSAAAAAESAPPRIYGGTASARQGGVAYLNIAAENFEKVGSMEVTVFYEPSVFSVQSVEKTGLNAGNTSADNDDPEQGALSLTAASGSEEGISGSGNLWRIGFAVAEDAEPKTYNIGVAVGEVTAADLSDLSVASGNGKIEVQERPVSIQTMYLYSSVEYSSAGAYEGEEVSVSFFTYNACGLGAAEFEIGYDRDRLHLEEIELGSALVSAEGAFSSINDDGDGYVKIAYANLKGISGTANPLVTCRFTVSGNEAGSVPVTFAPSGLYNSDRDPIRAEDAEAVVETLYRAPVVDLPDISIGSRENACGAFSVDVVAEGESGLAAAGIIVEFDPELLECVAIEGAAAGNPKYDTGKARFSFLNEDGISEDTVLASITFRPLVSSGSATLTLIRDGLADENGHEIEAELLRGNVSFAEHAWGEWAASGARNVERTCANCGEKQEIAVAGAATLTLEDEIKVNYKAWLRDPETREILSAQDFGLDVSAEVRIYESAEAEAAESVFDMVYNGGTGYYEAQNARSYAAKEIGDSHWLEIEVTLNGISVVFGRAEYSPKIYAMNQLSAEGEFGDLKNLSLALLDYAAAAQTHFGYKADDLANAGVTEEMRAAAEAYRETVYTQYKPYERQDLPGLTVSIAMSLNLDGRVTINGYLTAEGERVQMAVFESEAQATEIDNAAEVVEMTLTGGRYKGTTRSTQFAAKEFGDDVYIVFYVDGEAVTPAVRYGVKDYAYRMLSNPNTAEDVKALCREILNYASAAQIFFGYNTDDLANAGLDAQEA